MRSRRWKIYGIFYFTAVFGLVPGLAFAYIDPSVTTYAIQALAGVAVAAGAFFATYGRRMKKQWMRALDINEDEGRKQEAPLEVYREDLREELERVRQKKQAGTGAAGTGSKGRPRGRILTSVLCGLAAAMTVVLRPVLSFYLGNESEFWFRLQDVIGYVLIIFGGVGLGICLVHFLLPGKGGISPRLLFAALTAAVCIAVFIQNHFMTSYLPVLTGEPIDWRLYPGWGAASAALWIGLVILFLVFVWIKPRWAKCTIYGVFILLIFTETIAGGTDLLTAKHEEDTGEQYFSQAGMYETSDGGNIVVLVADTFEGTYMNEILEQYPEYREMLPEVTYYNNTTGVSILTYLSYTTLLTGREFQIGETEKSGLKYAFEHQTLADTIRKNGWDLALYTVYNPPKSMKGKAINYTDGEIRPDRSAAWKLAKNLWKSSLFLSAPQQIKDRFTVLTTEYEQIRAQVPTEEAKPPFAEDDVPFYETVRMQGLTAAKDAKPRYSLIQLNGLHDPTELSPDFKTVEYDSDVSQHERKLRAGRAMLLLLREYLDQLKKNGTYDKTTVILTADHGFNLRFYPVMLVKEAGSEQTAFRTDDTPLSILEDYETLMNAMTGGKSFSQAVKDLSLPKDRERYALNFRASEGIGKKATVKSIVEIRGPAWEYESYTIERDILLMDDGFEGRCRPGVPFIENEVFRNHTATYGIEDTGKIYGHNAAVDAFFNTEEERRLTLRMKLQNIAEADQRIIFRMDGETIAEFTIPADAEEEIRVELPEKKAARWTVEMEIPDAKLRIDTERVLRWYQYNSFCITEATFEET